MFNKMMYKERLIVDENAHTVDDNSNAKDTSEAVELIDQTKANGAAVEKAEIPTNETKIFSEETHKDLGEIVKSVVYGGLDGIITTFAIVSSVHGANLPQGVVLIVGLSNLIADAFSMGIGDYLSESAEFDFARSERTREKWEFDHFQEGEILEMVDIYEKKGILKEDAEFILRTMAKYPDFFVDHMLVEELEIQPVDEDESAVKNGLVTMGSFMLFGAVPLLAYVLTLPFKFTGYNPTFLISIILTVLTLLLLGGVKGKMTESNIWKSAFFVMLNGVAAAAASYLIGFILGQLTNVKV